MLNDVLIVPDLYGWITGRWAEEIARALKPFKTLTIPSWYLRQHPDVFRRLTRNARIILNIDPWFAGEVAKQSQGNQIVTSVLHHVNEDDPNAAFVAQSDLPVAACIAAQEYLTKLVSGSKRVLLIENGVDLKEFRPLSKQDCRQALAMSGEKFLVGYTGKASSDHKGRKGLDILERIIAGFVGDPKVEFVFCGGGWGEWSKSLSGRGAKVRNLGFIERGKLSCFYNAMDVIVSTSRNEAGPASVLEAMACAIPVVASQTGIVGRVVVTGENGFCLCSEDVEGFIKAIKNLSVNQRLAKDLGFQALATVESAWGWEKKMAPLASAVTNILKSRRVSPPKLDYTRPFRYLFESYLRKAEYRQQQIR